MLTPAFSANRPVRQYVDEQLHPALQDLSLRGLDCGGRAGADLWHWERTMVLRWPLVRFGRVDITRGQGAYSYNVEVHLGRIDRRR